MFLHTLKIKMTFLILVFTILFSFYPINSIQAQGYPVLDVQANTTLRQISLTLSGALPGAQQDKLNPSSPSNLKKLVLKRILRELTNSIVKWIDSGFDGNPSFITNTDQFLRDTADITIGDFLMNDPALSFLCDPFKIQVKLALGLQYRPFKEQIECSFTSALGNMNDAMNNFMNGDFIGGGGWNSWLQMTTVPQNNQMGAMILAQSELDARIEAKKGAAVLEANWGGGFMSWKDCPEKQNITGDTYEERLNERIEAQGEQNRIDSYAYVTNQEKGDDGCVIKTPGGIIANKINWADTSTIRELELADDINAIVNALANQMLTLGMQSISDSGLLGGNKPKPNEAYNEFMSYLSEENAKLINKSESGGNYSSGGSASFSQTFENKAIALETINSQISIENSYITAQNEISKILDAVQNSFNSSTCDTDLKEEISKKISGNYSGEKDLVWNKADINRDIKLSQNNLTALNNVASIIQKSTTNDSSVPAIVQPLRTMTTLHLSTHINSYLPGGSIYDQVQNWITSKIDNNSCVGVTTADLGM